MRAEGVAGSPINTLRKRQRKFIGHTKRSNGIKKLKLGQKRQRKICWKLEQIT